MRPVFHMFMLVFALGVTQILAIALGVTQQHSHWAILRLRTRVLRWDTNILVSKNAKICITPNVNTKICVTPTQTPNANRWNIGCKILVLAM